MNEHQRISDLKTSKGKGGALARALLTLPHEWEPWELEFLEDRARYTKGFESTRQAEKLIQLQDQAKPLKTIGDGYSAKILIRKCHEARADLDDEALEFIEKLHATGAETVTRRQGNFLLACARQLNILDA